MTKEKLLQAMQTIHEKMKPLMLREDSLKNAKSKASKSGGGMKQKKSSFMQK